MGASSSRMTTMRRRPSVSEPNPNRAKRLLYSLICGGASTSQPPSEMEEVLNKSPISSLENIAPVSHQSQSSMEESSATFGSETGFDSATTEVGTSEDNLVEYAFRNTGARSLLERKESDSHVNTNSDYKEVNVQKDSATASTFCGGETFLESVSADSRIILDDNLAIPNVSLISAEEHSRSAAEEHASGTSIDSHEGMGISASASISDPPLSLQLFDDDTHEDGLSDSDQDLRSGSSLHVDVVSVSSSSIAEISSREARRNNRRLFWDALSRRSLRRPSDTPPIVVTTGDNDDLGSHDRWVLDLSGDLHYDGIIRESDYPGVRRHRRNGRRWQLSSETSERSRTELEETTYCASGLHPVGTCSCDSFFTGEESSTIESISRIVMLAEALFEVLDEIHQQSLSLSLSVLCLPAPDFVVNSFPLKNYEGLYVTESEPSDVEQCHICLSEYEEGDKIRILPCHHEYHMSCVDKWLKEIHGVCPLCRYNVCDGVTQASTSASETLLHQ